MAGEKKKLKAMHDTSDNNYWQGFKDLYKDPDFIEAKKHEFIHGASQSPDTARMSSMSRRKFMALMGASAALAGAACTPYSDKGKIIPYVKGKEGLLPGIANEYASTYNQGGQSFGILVKTREGRPIKINGNPDHPINKGKIPSYVQAGILDLYDPVRLKTPQKKKVSELSFYENIYEEISWKSVDEQLIKIFENAVEENKEIAVVTHANHSPTAKKVFDDFLETYPTARFYHYEQFDNQTRRTAWHKCYGSDRLPLLHFNKANVIVSLDGDFLGTDTNSYSYIPEFSSRRDVVKKSDFNRLYVIESGFSQTALSADYRMKLKGDKYEEFLFNLASEILKRLKISNVPKEISKRLSSYNLLDFIKTNNLKSAFVESLINDIISEKEYALLYAGDQQSTEVHILVNLINELLGSSKHYDNNIILSETTNLSGFDAFIDLVENLKKGNISTVIHVGSNPIYHLPRDLGYEEAIKKAEITVSLGLTENETLTGANYVLPLHHTLESWGDAVAFESIYSLQQPVIEPLYNTRQAESAFIVWSSKKPEKYSDQLYHDYLKDNWAQSIYPISGEKIDFNKFWFTSLHDGIRKTKKTKSVLPRFNYTSFLETGELKRSTGYTLMFKPSYNLSDGKYANNGWLQEIPHPVSKITWDNYAAISVGTAQKIGVENNDLVEIQIEDRRLQIAVFIQPGVADDTIVMEMGFGRKIAGPIGSGVGFDVNQLRSYKTTVSPWIFYNASVNKIAGTYELMSTQEHYVIDLEKMGELTEKRHLIREATVNEYKQNPQVTKEKRHKVFSITDDWEYKGNKWGLAIDLNKCIGCSDCIASCNVENNIPVVGKDQVKVGREMHWMRIDRYYSGTPEEPTAHVQPMLCQHCDNAPCENVCPVAATVHSPEGLNDMAYNRCVGTRYCANNCPYKVRRFNFFNYRDHLADGYYESDSLALLANPEVTVRSRGVMEKCTFCVQRIAEEKDNAREERRDVDGNRIVTACQEACPSDAIVFGDINQETGELRQFRNHELGYHVLEEINVKPNVTYITKLKNTHTEDQA